VSSLRGRKKSLLRDRVSSRSSFGQGEKGPGGPGEKGDAKTPVLDFLREGSLSTRKKGFKRSLVGDTRGDYCLKGNEKIGCWDSLKRRIYLEKFENSHMKGGV